MNLSRLFPVWPLVVDTNIVRREVLRRVRRPGDPTRIATGLATKTIRVLTTPHVIAEMDEHLGDFAAKARVDADEYGRVWREYRSELTVVDVDGLLPDHALVRSVTDPDDVPLGVLAALLGVRALSADTGLGELATGEDDWLRCIIATTDAGLGQTVLSGVGVGVVGAAKGIWTGASGLHGYVSRQIGRDFADLAAVLVGAGVLFLFLYEPTRSAVLQSDVVRLAKSAGNQVLALVVDASVKGQQGREFLDAVAVVEPSPRIEMLVARVLVSSPSPVSVEELVQATNASSAAVEDTLHRYPAFREDEYGHWRIGDKLREQPVIVDAVDWHAPTPASWFATPLLTGPGGQVGPFAVPLSGMYPDLGGS